MKIKVYVLKEYCDKYAYGEENIRTYASREEAVGQLKKDVESWAGVKWDDLSKWSSLNEDNVLDEDYVSLNISGEYTNFFIVEQHTIDLPFDVMLKIDYEVETKYNIENAHQLNREELPENQLTDDEIEVAVERFEDSHDWNFPDVEQLVQCMHEVLEERKLNSSN